MKITLPLLTHIIDFQENYFPSIVIENSVHFRKIVEMFYDAYNGEDDDLFLSDNDTRLNPIKEFEIITSFIPFTLSTKSLISSLEKSLVRTAQEPEHIASTLKIIADIKQYLSNLVFNYPLSLNIGEINISSIVKSCSISFEDDVPLYEKIMEYMRAIRYLDHNKIFIFVGLRSYLSDDELFTLTSCALGEKYRFILIDNCSKNIINFESRITIDKDLCEYATFDDDIF